MTPRNSAIALLCSAAISLTGCAGAPGGPAAGTAGPRPAGTGQPPVASAAPAASPAPAAVAAENSPPSAYEAWGPWIGGVWVAQLPPDKDGDPRRMELSYTWGDNRASVRSEESVFKGETQADHVTGLISWNAADQDFRFQGTAPDGEVDVGTLRSDAGAWVCEVTRTERAGTAARERAVIKLVSADVATYQRFQLRGGFFVKVLDLRLERRWPNI